MKIVDAGQIVKPARKRFVKPHSFKIPAVIFALLLCLGYLPSLAWTANEKSIQAISSESSLMLEKKMKEKKEKKLLREIGAPEIQFEKLRVEKPALSERRFLVKIIRLEGNSAIPTEKLQPLLKPYEGREWTLAELQKLTQAITEKYNREGFISSFAYIPAQDVEKESIVIQVVEGKVGKLFVEGNRYFRTRRILSYSTLKEGETLRVEKIRRLIRNLNENPDREVSAYLQAGEVRQTSDIGLRVKDHFPLHAGFTYDNQGIKETGKNRFGFNLIDTNLTSLDDTFSVGTIFGSHSAFIFPQYQVPLNPRTNTKLILAFDHGRITTKKNYPSSHSINDSSQTYSVGIEQPILKRQRLSLDFQTRFEVKESNTLLDAATFSRERLRLLRFGPAFAFQDAWGATAFSQELIFGLEGLGATIFTDPSAARQGVKPGFFRFQGNLARSQKLPFGTRAIAKLEFQHSSRKVPSQEALYLGGASTVRGYPEADYLADSGILWSLDFLTPSFFIPSHW